MKTLIRLAVSACLAWSGISTAQTSLDFNLGGSGETIRDEFIFASGGVTATATGWSVSRTASNPVFQAGELVRWSPGIGVKSPTETITTTPYVPYYVDNQDHFDFVLFLFSEQVDISSVVVNPSSGTFDLDVSFWLGNVDSSLNLTGNSFAGLSDLGFGSRVNSDWFATNSSRSVNINSPSHGVNALLIGARVGGDSEFDRFKISTLRGTTVPPDSSVIPEPGSITLLGLGLSLLVVRRKR